MKQLLIIFLLIATPSFASIGDERFGETRFGDIGSSAIDVEATLSAIASISNNSSLTFIGELSLPAQANMVDAASVIRQGTIDLIAVGNVEQASQLLAYGAILLSTVGQTNTTSNVDWQVLLDLSTRASYQLSAGAGIYTAEIDLATSAQIAQTAGVVIPGSIELNTVTSMSVIASVIREGIITLNAQGNMQASTQLAAYGAILLRMTAEGTIGSNATHNVSLVLSAVARAIVIGDFSDLVDITTRRIFIKDNKIREFKFDNYRRILDVK